MSAYSVGTSPDGTRLWWANWELAGWDRSGYTNVRAATDEEAALMEKIVWETETPDDRKRLRGLLKCG